jgi:hypothetical protein
LSDNLLTALVSVGGMLAVAILGAIVQVKVTRQIVASEFRKVGEQLAREAGYRRAEQKAERVLDSVASLLAEADPESNASVSYQRVVAHIHRIQLMLDLSRPQDARLNSPLTELGLALRQYLSHPDPHGPDAQYLVEGLFRIQSDITVAAQALVTEGHRLPALPGPDNPRLRS